MIRYTLIILILCTGITSAQTFSKLAPGLNKIVTDLEYDSTTNILFVGGGFTGTKDGLYARYIIQWNGVYWDSLGSGIGDGGIINSIKKYNGNMYFGGSFSKIGGLNAKGIAYWDGNKWNYFADLETAFGTGAVEGLYVNGNDLYAVGDIAKVNGMPANMIAKFDGTLWHTYPVLDTMWGGGAITCAIIYKNELYVGGNFDGGPNKADIVKFDGTNWVSVGGGLSGANTWVNCFSIYQGMLYVGGYFQAANGDPGNNIAIWDGNNWSQAGSGVMPSNVWDIHEFQGELYVAGQFGDAGGVPVTGIAKWDGTQWYDIGGIFDDRAYCLTSYNNDLYIGGNFVKVNGDSMWHITKYTSTVGIGEKERRMEGVSVYPNPVQDKFTIHNSQYTIKGIEIYNVLGEKVYSEVVGNHSGIASPTAQASPSLAMTVDVSGWASGVYLLTVRTEEGVITKRIVKM